MLETIINRQCQYGVLWKPRVDKLETEMRTSDGIFVTIALSRY